MQSHKSGIPPEKKKVKFETELIEDGTEEMGSIPARRAREQWWLWKK